MLSSLRSSVLVLGLVAASAACAPPADEPGDATETAESSVARVPGNTIGSAFVDPSKTYLRRRKTGNLLITRALDAEAYALAERVDGIIANKPRDGYVTVEELVAMEQPAQFTLLFPAEKATLPRIWNALEIGAMPPVINLAGAPLGDKTLADRVQPVLTPPSPIVLSKLAISTLPYNLRNVASRVELGYDDDGDPTTISPGDVAAAKATPGPFTQSELDAIAKIAEEHRTRAVSTASARLVFPYDGVAEERFGAAGPFEIVRQRRLAVHDHREAISTGYANYQADLSVDLKANERVRDLLLFNGKVAMVSLFSTTTDDEYLVESVLRDEISDVPAGRYLAQVFTKPGLGYAPPEGGPCVNNGQIFERSCGSCGMRPAICIGGVVSTYGVCGGEITGCLPGSQPPAPAGWFEVQLGPNNRPAYTVGFSEIGETLKLRAYADYEVVTAAGAPITRWLGYSARGPARASWTYGPFDPDFVGNKDFTPSELAALGTSIPTLPVGRYPLDTVTDPGTTLDVYPNGVVTVASGTTPPRRLLPSALQGTSAVLVTEDGKDPLVTLDAATGEVRAKKAWSYDRTATLRASQRL